ncbi:hypothetical protein AWC38_SpisGene7113 [Stylophora pistillata]|uniref:Uncharacterized protein n=1 Tax=Stylophora pistillata TaxID=50429 RepID=A0A2B4SBZ8_STYPI|nr:hypothetical protein AWC38_SpisGene7113 [Stylophora pistillata]
MHYKSQAVTPHRPDVCLNLRFEQFKVPPEERNIGFSFVFTSYIILLACIIQIQASLAISRPTDYQISTVNKEWIVSGEVDKIFLRKEIREFCDQYPVYRLREYVPDSVSVGRSRRAAYFYSCRNHVPDNGCSPQDWKYRCRVRTRSCVYYITCNLDERRKTISCNKLRHTSSQTMCCNPYCPYGRASYGKGR